VNTEELTTVATVKTWFVASEAPTDVTVDIAALAAPALAVLSPLISAASVSRAGGEHCATLVSVSLIHITLLVLACHILSRNILLLTTQFVIVLK